ncbi:hypothetical protein D3C87_1408700 [compost metagenome]
MLKCRAHLGVLSPWRICRAGICRSFFCCAARLRLRRAYGAFGGFPFRFCRIVRRVGHVGRWGGKIGLGALRRCLRRNHGFYCGGALGKRADEHRQQPAGRGGGCRLCCCCGGRCRVWAAVSTLARAVLLSRLHWLRGHRIGRIVLLIRGHHRLRRKIRSLVAGKFDQQRKPCGIRPGWLFQDFCEHRKAQPLQDFADLLFQRQALRCGQGAQRIRQTHHIGLNGFAVAPWEVHQLAKRLRQNGGAAGKLIFAGERGDCGFGEKTAAIVGSKIACLRLHGLLRLPALRLRGCGSIGGIGCRNFRYRR